MPFLYQMMLLHQFEVFSDINSPLYKTLAIPFLLKLLIRSSIAGNLFVARICQENEMVLLLLFPSMLPSCPKISLLCNTEYFKEEEDK